MELKKILVPTDFSEEANYALDVAAAIARKAHAEISLLNVIDVPLIGNYSSTEIINNENDSSGNFHKAFMMKYMDMTKTHIDQAKEKYNDINISQHVIFDNFDKQLFEFVTNDNTDLIVMGSKGTSGLKEYWVGSKTQKVIQFAKSPVLTVKSKIDEFNAGNIVFASRFLKVPDNVISALKTFQKLFDSQLHFLKISTANTFYPTKDIEKSIKDFAENNGFENYTINNYNALTDEDGIREFADLINADLTFMITHGRTGLARLFWGSVAEKVANESYKPILTFNQNRP